MLKIAVVSVSIRATTVRQGMIKIKDLNNRHVGVISKVIPLKLFLSHSRFRKSVKDLEIANPVTRIMLT